MFKMLVLKTLLFTLSCLVPRPDRRKTNTGW